MIGKTSNRWLIALVTLSVLALAVPQSATAAPFKAEPAGGTSAAPLGQLLLWAADLWNGLGSLFDATTATPGTGGADPQAGTSSGGGGEQGGMIDPNG